ncbi:MAG: FKBP-type peptidylprolyl isomerase [Flavobacteriaceae bacterium]|jgi:FKBP-type peptidyl-prolyl cis-trans isomerase FkpA|nr:MAG: FKBP-type peptidylprolyl isomerase [Flavobacteriaceae bacterium]
MTRIKLFLIAVVSSTVLFSCKKDDDSSKVAPPRDRATQYASDIQDIETYLKTHYLTVTMDANNNPVPTIIQIPEGGTQVSIWDQQDYPLKTKMVRNDGRTYTNADPIVGKPINDPVEYKLYYIKLREGVGQSPTRVDSTLVTYRGNALDGTQFDYRPNPVWFSQESVVSGWRNIMTEFKSGNAVDDPSNPGGTLLTDYGVGIVFVPSGLGYFNGAPAGSGLSSYSPLVFTINLHMVKYADNDGDGILSYLEDLNGNGDYYDDDTDGDGIPNFLDVDDDGDRTKTRTEIKDAFGNIYPFDLIPNCSGTTGGLKKHLDPSCH